MRPDYMKFTIKCTILTSKEKNVQIHSQCNSLIVVPLLPEWTSRKWREVIFKLLLKLWQHQQIHNATAYILFILLRSYMFRCNCHLQGTYTKFIKTCSNKYFYNNIHAIQVLAKYNLTETYINESLL
jgi:hypothetical protein